MILKVIFDKTNVTLPIVCQKELNSFIYRTLGDNNKYHDSFSDYSISSIQGGKLYNKNELKFIDNPYIIITSLNNEFINDMIVGLEKRKYDFFGMKYKKMEISEFMPNKRFDIINTISPVIVKLNNRKISIDNELFIQTLKQNCIDKLKHKGVEDETFDIFIRNKHKTKKKYIIVGDVFNICTNISLYVYGKPNTRKILYNMGLGGSTGSGFGTIKMYH